MLPHQKITEILDEVERWTAFTRHFTHLKNISVTPLSQFSLNGKSTQAILKSKLGIYTL